MMRARETLRQALGTPGGEESPGSTEPKPRKRPRRERAECHRIEVNGDRPHTFIVRGDLYITIGADRAEKS